jgi:hypothetical protein
VGTVTAMTIAHAYTLLLEIVVSAASFGILWLSFWLRDGHRRHDRPTRATASDFTIHQQDSANCGPLVLPTIASIIGLPIDVTSSDVQPASEEDKTILHRSEDVQYFHDKPQIEAEQNQRTHLEPMNSDPVKIHGPALLVDGAALAQGQAIDQKVG